MSESDSPSEAPSHEEPQPSQTHSLPLDVVIEATGSVPKPVKTIRAALTHWKRRLLDLSKRNRLLNFKSTPVSTIALVDEQPAEVFRTLWLRDGSMKFKAALTPARRNGEADANGSSDPWAEQQGGDDATVFEPYESGAVTDRHTDDVLQTSITAEQLDRSLRRIEDQARLSLEEQGVNTLFLALGMLSYKESRDSEEMFRAPLILLPVSLARKSARAGYVLTASDDDPVVNPALVEYLRQNHGIELPQLPDLEALDDRYNLSDWFTALAATIARFGDWIVQKNIYLGLFSFQKFMMYKDLEANAPAFGTHRLIEQIVTRTGGQLVGLPKDVLSVELDTTHAPEKTFQVVDADSSQLRAIVAAATGYNLVLEGPPGTGKSQTITNLIAQALAGGKTVLFVAEKMAALEVVHQRLVGAGLGEFCLEVHSTKANKRAVMQQVRAALDASLQRPAVGEPPAARLKAVRDQLSRYVEAVHQPYGALNMSPYRGFGELGKLIDAPKVAWSGDAETVTLEAIDAGARQLRDVEVIAKELGDVTTHPWRDATRVLYSESDLDSIEAIAKELIPILTDLLALAARVGEELGLPTVSSFADLSIVAALADILRRSPGARADVLRSDAWNVAPSAATRIVQSGRQWSDLKLRLDSKLIPDAFLQTHETDCQYVEAKSQGILSWLAFLDGRYRSVTRRWKAYRQSSHACTIFDQVSDMRLVDECNRQKAQLVAQQAEAEALFGALWRAENSDWNALDHYIAWVVEFRAACMKHALREEAYQHAGRSGADVSLVNALCETGAKATDALHRLRQAVGWPELYLQAVPIVDIVARVSALCNAIDGGPGWASFEAARQSAAAGPGAEALDAAMRRELPFDQLARAFKRAVFQRWLVAAVRSRPELAQFQTLTHERRIEEFRALDRAVLEANRLMLVRDLRDSVQDKLRGPDAIAQMPVLRRELARQRSLSPLRKTMRAAHAAIRAIKPCFLMSPLSVAQLLEGGTPSFDLVIFDEASQLPTEDAVGSIIRGQQLVVVGDPKQLPPTNFFAVMNGQIVVAVDDDGNPLYEDTESVLEECMGAGLSTGRLKWHYRSAHESLIAFSNVSFYDGDLYTFPGVETGSERYGLQFDYVDGGVYEGKGLNLVEARRVADAVMDHARRHPNLSLGVGTFNLRQQLAIQDELEVRRRQDSSVEEFFSRGHEPFFVKNLENIQGDERDVIFISVTYGKGADGRLRYNFGPLNTQNGWRRLNVLVTRARKRMRVFSSIRGEDISPTATTSDGPRLLRDFLVYAEHGRLDGTTVRHAADTESPFERDVFSELSRRGLRLQPQVGVGGYRIDFGVLDDAVLGRFICGIECDGVAYHSSETARDRDRLRHEVLETRGWEIHRIWSTDWFKDRGGQIDRLLRLVEISRVRCKDEAAADVEAARKERAEEESRLLAEVEAQQTGAAEPSPPIAASQPEYVRPRVEEYRLAAVEGRHEGRDLLAEPAGTIRAAIQTVLAVEAPLHFDDLASRVASMWSTRLGSRIEARIRSACRDCERTGLLRMRGRFVWPASGEFRVRSRGGARISADRIPPEEYRQAAILVLGASRGMPKYDLVSEVRAVLGFARTGAALEEAITSAIDDLIGAGKVGEGSMGLMLRT
jgi:very-short-patch-repair endonuclease